MGQALTKRTVVNGPKSMTGFGVASGESKSAQIEVELKAANSRFLDLIFRLPRGYTQFESDVRSQIAQILERGRVEVSVVRTVKSAAPVSIHFNDEAYDALAAVYKRVGKQIGASTEEIRKALLTDVLARHEVLEVQEQPAETEREKEILLQTVKRAVEALDMMRSREGTELAKDIRRRIGTLTAVRKRIGAIVARKPELARDRLLNAVKRLAKEVQLDENRLHTEVALLADRSDVTEEIVRLESHLSHFSDLLERPPVGKKLDFLIQELVREFNTIGSKAQDAEVQAQVVEAKSELEKIREQVQNLE